MHYETVKYPNILFLTNDCNFFKLINSNAETQAESLNIMATETQTETLNSNVPFSPVMPTTPYWKTAPGKIFMCSSKFQNNITQSTVCLFPS